MLSFKAKEQKKKRVRKSGKKATKTKEGVSDDKV
jgi:hypothetical protein